MSGSAAIEVRPPATSVELAAALHLRYDCYVREGYVLPDPSGLLSDLWDGLPATAHLLALSAGAVVGAVRLVGDSEHGLPMERVFPSEVQALRSRGRKLAEASALVCSCTACNPRDRVWLELCRAAWQQTVASGVNDVCVAVTRNHVDFYRRLLFVQMGDPRQYGPLCNVTAFPMRLHVAHVTDQPDRGDCPHAMQLRHRLRGGPATA
jgi:hypothetical protein